MPTYDMLCTVCGKEEEVFQAMSAPNPRCDCGATMQKVMCAVGVKWLCDPGSTPRRRYDGKRWKEDKWLQGWSDEKGTYHKITNPGKGA